MHFEFMGEGLKITGLGFSIVFLVLIIIWLILEIMKKIFEAQNKKNASKPLAETKTEVQNPTPPKKDDGELLAVITAAVACALKTETHNIKIKSYKRISNSSIR